MTRVGTGPRRSRAMRLTTVGRSVAASSAARMMQAAPTGSSRTFSSAFWASGLSRWASSMSATRMRPSIGSSARSAMSPWTAPSLIWSPAPSGASR